MERLNTLKQYLEEALLDPRDNKFYIEDLKSSIETQEKVVLHERIVMKNVTP